MRSEARDYLAFERDAWDRGLKLVAGVDEAGRGPLAGPVVAAAVVFKRGHVPDGIRDSKELSPKRRQELFPRICEEAVAVGLGIISEKVIDRINILRATQLAMRRAISGLNLEPHLSLIDGMRVPGINLLQRAIVDGDRLSVSIAAASIIAKVTRDRIMVEQDRLYPLYGFASHKGYGTRAHVTALKKYGPCKIHRFSFRPVREAAEKQRGIRDVGDIS
jgi:ribonuclease HII